jgi:hypothetical protein
LLTSAESQQRVDACRARGDVSSYVFSLRAGSGRGDFVVDAKLARNATAFINHCCSRYRNPPPRLSLPFTMHRV